MSTKTEVLNDLFAYVCAYLAANNETCTCCCPNTAFTFDITRNPDTNVYEVLHIHTWNFNTAQPTLETLQTITPQAVATAKNLQKVRLDKTMQIVKQIVNLSRELNREITDADLVGLL
jgi:hypothetical protein